MTLRISLSNRWTAGASLDAANPLHPGEDAGQVEGKGDGKVERSLQTRRGRESESLFSSGWQRYEWCSAQELKCPRRPACLACPQVGALTWITSEGAGADRNCAAKCRCSVPGLGQGGAREGPAPPAPRPGRGRPRPRGEATGVAAPRSASSWLLVVSRRLEFLAPHGCPLTYPVHSHVTCLVPSANALVAACLK